MTERGVPLTGIVISQAMASAVVLPVLVGGEGGEKVLEVVLSIVSLAVGAVFLVTVLADIHEMRTSGTPPRLIRKAGIVVALGFSLAVILSAAIETVENPESLLVLVLWIAIGAGILRWLGTHRAAALTPH